VSLVAILDADKEGFLRSERSLIQTIGARAPFERDGDSLRGHGHRFDEAGDRRDRSPPREASRIQRKTRHHAIGISKSVHDMIEGARDFDDVQLQLKAAQEQARYESMVGKQLAGRSRRLEKQMLDYARNLEFEKAAEARIVSPS